MHNLIKRLFLLCLAKAVFSVADNVPCELGGKVVLKPDSGTNPPSSILWRLGQNKVADFDTDFGPDVTYYSDFNGRTTLNTTTGELTITGLRKTDEGVYSVEFNSKRLEKTYTLSVLKPVPKPAIIVSCNDNKTSCTLTCNGYTAGAEPVTYWWKVGEGNWENIGKLLTVDKSDSKLYQNGYKYTCKLKNPFSEEVSYSVKDVFGPVSSSTTRTVAVAVSIIVTIVLIGIGLTFVLVWKKKRDYPTDSVTEFLLKTLRQPCVFCHCTGETSNSPTPGFPETVYCTVGDGLIDNSGAAGVPTLRSTDTGCSFVGDKSSRGRSFNQSNNNPSPETAKDVEGLNQPTGKDSEGANTPTAETPLTTKD